ncbi:MAG TPA: hypothetical protein VFC56_12470 [Stellaceae bacterium]|nr:hypothetical protein [Stellaceae bacterium]
MTSIILKESLWRRDRAPSPAQRQNFRRAVLILSGASLVVKTVI